MSRLTFTDELTDLHYTKTLLLKRTKFVTMPAMNLKFRNLALSDFLILILIIVDCVIMIIYNVKPGSKHNYLCHNQLINTNIYTKT